MKSVKVYVCNCMECGKSVMFKIDFTEFNDNCCLDFKNLKILKTFNDEMEARNYFNSISQNEE